MENKVVATFPDCSAEVLDKEGEKRMKAAKKVIQLTNLRIALYDKILPEVVIAEVVSQEAWITPILMFKKQDVPEFDGQR